jgi:hypothetical protein
MPPLCLYCRRRPARPLAIARPPGMPASEVYFCSAQCAARYGLEAARLRETEERASGQQDRPDS